MAGLDRDSVSLKKLIVFYLLGDYIHGYRQFNYTHNYLYFFKTHDW